MKFVFASIVVVAAICFVCEADVSLLSQQGYNGANLHQRHNQQEQGHQQQGHYQHQRQRQQSGYEQQHDTLDFHFPSTSHSSNNKGSGYKYEKPSQPIEYPSQPNDEYLPVTREPVRTTAEYLPPSTQHQEREEKPQSLEYLPPSNDDEQQYQHNDIYQGPGQTRRTNKHF